MAQPTIPRFNLTHITILLPLRGSVDPTCIDASSGKIQVLVQNPPDHDCEAETSYFVPGSGLGDPIHKQRLVRIGTTDLYHVFLEVGSITGTPTVNNRAIKVTDLTAGESTGYTIRVIHCGSGSGSNTSTGVATKYAAVWPLGKPIPVGVMLKLDSPVRPGMCSNCDQLNRPTVLTHAQDAGFTCCWFSQPLDFCADGAEPGWWMLQRTDIQTWTLRLRYQNMNVATYQLRTAQDNDCKLPIKLHLVGGGGPECKNWPRTVTIAPAL